MKIEYGVPIPKRGRGKGRPPSAIALLMRKMKKGGCLWVDKKPAVAVQMAIRCIGRGNYISRSEDGGTRIWKIK